MSSVTAKPASEPIRHQHVAEVSRILPQQVARVGRLLVRLAGGPLSRSEATTLATLAERPSRITELAELEGLAQPTMTLLVKRLEEQGLVLRRRDSSDARAVLVEITPAGEEALEALRERFWIRLSEHLGTSSDAEVEGLLHACRALEQLGRGLQEANER
jgi:DNA-binding MarR family transcriptional regulator